MDGSKLFTLTNSSNRYLLVLLCGGNHCGFRCYCAWKGSTTRAGSKPIMSLLKLISFAVLLSLASTCHSKCMAIRGQLSGSELSPSTLFRRQGLSVSTAVLCALG